MNSTYYKSSTSRKPSANGIFTLNKEWQANHLAYLKAFSTTLRVARDLKSVDPSSDLFRIEVGLPLGEECEFYTGAALRIGQASIIKDYKQPPKTQPSTWCCWNPTSNGLEPILDVAGRHFEDHPTWLQYMINNFIEPWGYVLNGKVKISGYFLEDVKVLAVKNNQLSVLDLQLYS